MNFIFLINSQVLKKVDCTDYPLLCSEQYVSGYPTLKLYQNHQAKEDYLGGRSSGGAKPLE